MFGIGPTELIVILVIALLVLGPKRLPELAAGLGKGLAEFRRATSDINAELDQARRAVEEPAKEATRTVQSDRRVSRTNRRAERPVTPTAASDEDADEQSEPAAAEPAAAESAAESAAENESDDGDTTPKQAV